MRWRRSREAALPFGKWLEGETVESVPLCLTRTPLLRPLTERDAKEQSA
jgi:hypothetical protein